MRFLATAAFLVLSHTAAANIVETDINLNIFGNALFKSDPTGATISASEAFGGESGQGTAGFGTLKARTTSTVPGAINDSSLVEFLDSLAFIGSGSIGISQVPEGTLTVNGLGTALVIANVTVTGAGLGPGLSTNYEKQVSTLSSNFVSDDGPLVLPVTNGQSISVLAILRTFVTASADADYASTDNVYITALTPGLQIISASGHDYSPPGSSAAVPEPSVLPLLGLGGLAVLGRRRYLARKASVPSR